MKLKVKATLGRTNLDVGRLGVSSSYGANAATFEEAFEYGLNYFTWGTFVKGDSGEMKKAIRNIVAKGKRDQLVISAFSYAHEPFLTKYFLRKRIKALGVDYIDILLLGYFPKLPSDRILNGIRKLKEQGIIKHIGISGHNRLMFKDLNDVSDIDVMHLRYSAAHRGAEKEVFPHFQSKDRPGIVSFTATRWGKLLNPKNMPKGESTLTAADCYRYVLSNPSVDVCMMGIRNSEQLRENISIMEMGALDDDELNRIERIGEFVYAN